MATTVRIVFLDRLNDDCLTETLSYLSPLELIHCRAVSRRWCRLISLICQQTRTMKLFGTVHDLREYCHSVVKHNLESDWYFSIGSVCSPPTQRNEIIGSVRNVYKSLNIDDSSPNVVRPLKGEFLSKLFPNVRELVVSFTRDDTLDLTALLKHWPRMVRLTIFSLPDNLKLLQPILDQLKSLHHLKVLELFGTIPLSNECFTIPSSLLPQLDHLCLGSYPRCTTSILSKLGTSLNGLMLTRCQLTDMIRFLSTERGTLLLSQINYLSISPDVGGPYITERQYRQGVGLSLEVLNFICENFIFLEFFEFTPSYRIPFLTLIESLSKLSQLNELSIVYYSEFKHSLKMNPFPELSIEPDYPQLSTVQTFYLKHSRFLESPRALTKMIVRVFPILECIHLVERCSKTEFMIMRNNFHHLVEPQLEANEVDTNLTRIPVDEQEVMTNLAGRYANRLSLYKVFKLT